MATDREVALGKVNTAASSKVTPTTDERNLLSDKARQFTDDQNFPVDPWDFVVVYRPEREYGATWTGLLSAFVNGHS